MRKSITFFLLLLLIAACTKEEENLIKPSIKDAEIIQELDPMSPSEINAYIKSEIENTGSFEWNNASDHLLWSASVHGNNIITIGYGVDAYSNHKSSENISIKNKFIDKINKLETNINKSDKETLLYDDGVLNYIDVIILDLETVKEIRKEDNIRYIEPSGYNFFSYEQTSKSGSGCSTDAASVNTNDYRTVSPGCLVPWTFDNHNITQAWAYSTGENITVGLVDTGVSDYQSLLGSSFSDGISTSSRYVYKYGTYVDSWLPWATTTDGYHDKCGHGTSMAATIASPRNDNSMPVGVAYNCNLISYRATEDVVLDGYQEQKGVANAITNLANTSSVKIISMSIGHIITIGKISDAIIYAYSKGKLIFAAGGTSTWFTNWVGVTFPASMSETVAVTGITDEYGYEECEICHTGVKIDFTVIMERYYDTNRHSVCLGYYNNQIDYVGGSSVSTAFTAGIAALVWSKYPSWSRDQILTKLKQSADFYPNKDSNFGYGNIDALAAVQ